MCFVRASLMGFAWFTPIESSLGGNGLAWFSWFPVIVIILTIEADETLGLLKFSLAAALAGVAMLANSGLLGDGKLAYTVANCDLAVAVAWCIAAFLIGRRNDSLDRPFTFPPVA